MFTSEGNEETCITQREILLSPLRLTCSDVLPQIEHLTNELARMRENLKSEKSEVYKWKDLVKELRSLLDGKNDEIERKRDEVSVLFYYIRYFRTLIAA